MSDEEEESMSEGFSASEDEWKPTKGMADGCSSDDDDSDFENSTVVGANASGGPNSAARKTEAKSRGGTAKTVAAVRKRKPSGQSLRTKLFNKYRPPPKTFPSPSSSSGGGGRGNNSPSASTSRTASKNAKTPNESDENDSDASSDSSVDDHLVNPAELDLGSSFFDVQARAKATTTVATSVGEVIAPPIFDCNAGVGNLSDSGSEDNNESSADDDQKPSKAFDFRNLLEKAQSLERAKATIAKRSAARKDKNVAEESLMDVGSLLALGEKQQSSSGGPEQQTTGRTNEENDDESGTQKLAKTKSTRVKRHTKTRPASTVVHGGDSDDSDWEEVADGGQSGSPAAVAGSGKDLVIHVELPTRQRGRKDAKKQQDLELAFKRRLNRDLKERQIHLHKTSLLCLFGRSYTYNRLLNDASLMQEALKLLPSSNAYPPECGTSVKYLKSLTTWFRTCVKQIQPNLYLPKFPKKTNQMRSDILQQIKKKEARCKQEMVCIFVILLRGMGLQCRFVVNLQPLPLKPAQTDLLPIKLKKDDEKTDGTESKKAKAPEAKEESKKDEKPSKSKGGGGENQNRSSTSKKEGKNYTITDEEDLKGFTNSDDQTDSDLESKIVPKRWSTRNREKAAKEKHPPDTKEGVQEDSKPVAKDTKKSTKDTIKESTKESPKAARNKNTKGVEEDATKTSRSRRGGREAASKMVTEVENSFETKGKRVTKKAVKKEEEPTKAEDLKLTNEAVLKREPQQRRKTQSKVPAEEASELKRTRTTRADQDKEEDVKDTSSTLPAKPKLSRLKRTPVQATDVDSKKQKKEASEDSQNISQDSIENIQPPEIRLPEDEATTGLTHGVKAERVTRSRSKSPKFQISPQFLKTKSYLEKFPPAEETTEPTKTKAKREPPKKANEKLRISIDALTQVPKRILRSRQKSNEAGQLSVPQLDGADDTIEQSERAKTRSKRPQLSKLQKSRSHEDSEEDFEPSPSKRPKVAPLLSKAVSNLRQDRRVLSTDDETTAGGGAKRREHAADMWAEVWSEVEDKWVCVDLFKGHVDSIDAIKKFASSNLAYVFAYQNDLSVKDVTARYCANWSTVVRKGRVERTWLEEALIRYKGKRTTRDLCEDQELRRVHEEKPMPTAISDYKDHPFYALERHLLKFQAIYPPEPPTLGYVRGEPVYSRDCVHVLHSREIWLKQARTVKLGEQPYKVVKARPKWDRLTQSVIKDQPLEIFGYWQTEDYDPPTAENGLVPRNAYGNVELFKACMLPKKCAHVRLSGLNRICKKLGIDCANAVVGFDFHQGACHPTYDGFVICEEFVDQVTAAWYQDQEDQKRKEQEKYEARVYGNWKKLIRGLLIRQRLKRKYNF